MKFDKDDIFCNTYGRTLHNLVWGHFLTWSRTGIAVGDMSKEIGISRPKAYQIVKEFMKKGYVVTDRVVGKTQLYKLNEDNQVVKIFKRNFKECLQMVFDEYKKNKSISSNSSVSISAKSA